ncbi:glucose/mannose transport system permease protein [Phyllobacterium trifolii]|jgi:glucose/mannose transport system permease protein|uniref:Glucose/mannose transport system permease protein n=1 Tax=Phyllobacterium trifolii TaxID=300193 RepID=A0A839UJT9_9HYPH|nr:carbohydrate ABC transporter permease [Phyllobacterium trifolii]MBB3148871.1 glucose/mannose transport system permease protein [Phyllobacterium trifolii]
MSAQSPDNAISGGKLTRVLIYAALFLFAFYYLLPLYVMLVNSLKPLEEIRQGGMLSPPREWTIQPWLTAWSTAQIGVQPTGLRPYFINSILMVVPAVAISTVVGALNGYVLTKWKFRGSNLMFGMLLLGCFIPFQIVLIPMARMLGLLGMAGTIQGLILVHIVYGLGFTTLYFRNYYEAFPTELVRAAQIDGASFFQIFRRILLPSSGPIIVVSVIWQFTNIWNDFLFGASFSGFSSTPMTVALNNLVNSSTGVKEYNVHFAGAILAALPTLIVYIVSGRYFVRGLMSGAVKG